MVNPNFKDRTYVYDKASEYRYFEVYDTLNTKVLGEVLAFEPSKGFIAGYIEDAVESSAEEFTDEDDETPQTDEDINEEIRLTRETPQVNFVEVKVGDGAFYYNLNPIAFTNYYMLKDGKHQYAEDNVLFLL